MQTFLPYPDYALSARVLDYRRLGKQRVESYQLLLGQRSTHPASRMWRGHHQSLLRYTLFICQEWTNFRHYNDSIVAKIMVLESTCTGPNWTSFADPPWLGDPAFHSSHRAALLFKDYTFYSQYGWTEKPQQNYIWPNANPSN